VRWQGLWNTINNYARAAGIFDGSSGGMVPPIDPEDLIHELCKKIMQRQMRQDWKLRLMISSRPCKSTAITWIVWPPITS
jgi:hypothetical protein